MEKKLQKTISYTLQFIDSTRVMVSLSSNLVYNFSEAIHRTKCKFGRIEYKYCHCFLEYTNLMI